MAGEPYSDFAVPGTSYGSKLSDEASMFFISLVEHFPALWDMTMSEYANNALKGALWRQIADEMEDRYPECGPYVPDTLKTFFNNKRRTYRAEKKKLETSKSGQASSDSYKGKWKFFHCLKFLDAAKPTGTRTFSEAFEVAEPEAQNAGQSADQDADPDANIEYAPQPSPASVSTASSSSVSRKARSSQPSANDWAARTAALEKIAVAVQQPSDADDASAHFAKAAAALMRPMNPLKLVRCQAEILSVIEKHLTE
ncbi:uncharacterized protein ISCGN_026166 [Ixodes scapularis]